jgi:putative glutathione S-transferase
MGRLIDGDWHDSSDNKTTTDVAAEPTDLPSGLGSDEFPVEPDRYHVYVSRACPWAHGVVLVRKLLGLEDAVSMDVVDPHRETEGWRFAPDKDGCTTDSIHGASALHEVYTAADPDYTGRVSVPLVWDRERETVLGDESIEVMRAFADGFADESGVDLYPDGHREAIDRVVDDLYESVNRGVYWAGFADTQAEYEQAVTEVFDALDHWESVLADQRFLAADQLTLADLRLFATLVRFDNVYHTHFKCNSRRVVDYPNLWGHTRDVYQLPGVADTVNVTHIKEHYYRSHDDINPTGFVPVGPELDFEAPHSRDELPGEVPGPLQD